MNHKLSPVALMLVSAGLMHPVYAQIVQPAAMTAPMAAAPATAQPIVAGPVLTSPGMNETAPAADNVPQGDAVQNGEADADAVNATANVESCSTGQFENDFQALVCDAMGVRLSIFGSELFRKSPSTFSPVENVPVAGDYRLQPGDEFQLTTWGQVSMQLKLRVDNNGDIFIPEVGKFNINGMAFSDLERRIDAEMSRYFRNYRVSVTMGRLNQLPVFVTGFAKNPGRYNVSSVSTLLNALFASGGPSAQGSLRRVELKRDGKLVGRFDLYALLMDGDKRADLRLQAGDVIHIPPVGERVAITGPVKVPAIYELNVKETLADLMKWAGGLTTTASGVEATLERIQNRSSRTVNQIQLKQANNLDLADGDIVQIYPMLPKYENMVTIRGSIGLGQRVRWHDGMTVKDVIPSREMLLTSGFWNRLNSTVDARNATTDSLRYDLKRDEANEINWDYAVIERIRPEDFGAELIPFNLGKAIGGDEVSNIRLQSGDAISIFSKSDVRVASEKRSHYVKIEGEIAVPGIYGVKPGETLRQLVARIGGLSKDAYLYGAVFSRPSIRAQQQQMLDDAVSRFEKEVEADASAKLADVTLKDNISATQAELARNRKRVGQMRQVKALGRVAFEFSSPKVKLKDIPEIALEDGDSLYVPRLPSTVSIFGAVNSASAYLYQPAKNVGDYVDSAGGYTRLADQQSVFVMRANGTAYGTNSTGWFSSLEGYRPAPGDAIIVPEQIERGLSFTQSLKEWASILYQLGLSAAGLKVLKD